jgi:integrase
MASIQGRKDGKGKTRWRVQIRIQGHPTVSKTFDRKTDAKDWAKQTETDIKRGQYFQSMESTKHTFGEMVDRYLKDVMPRKSEDQRRHQTQQLKWWKDQLGSFNLSEVSVPKIVEARDVLARKKVRGGKERSPASVNRYLAALSHVYSIASREWGWVEQSPMRKVGRLTEATGRVRFLSDGERSSLLKACKESSDDLLYPIVVLALSTGARQGEILNLRWGDVDLERKVIRLEKTKNR